jgi:hypothetical protein
MKKRVFPTTPNSIWAEEEEASGEVGWWFQEVHHACDFRLFSCKTCLIRSVGLPDTECFFPLATPSIQMSKANQPGALSLWTAGENE